MISTGLRVFRMYNKVSRDIQVKKILARKMLIMKIIAMKVKIKMRSYGKNREEREKRRVRNILTSYMGAAGHVGIKIRAKGIMLNWLSYLKIN